MGDARIKRGWGGSMTPAGSGTYRGGTSRATRAGGYRKGKSQTSKSDGGLNKVIKTAEKAAAPKGLTFRHVSVGSDARTRVGGGSPGSRVAGGLARFKGR